MCKLRFMYTTLICLFFLFNAKCEDKDDVKSKNPLPYFRRQVEGIVEASTIDKLDKNYQRSNLVSFLVKNVKEIFNELVDTTEISSDATTTSEIISETETIVSRVTHTTDIVIYKNVSLSALIDKKLDVKESSTETFFEMTGRSELFHLSKDLKFLKKSEQKQVYAQTSINPFEVLTTFIESDRSEPKRSCVSCNNVIFENCNDPQNKLITSVVCEHNEDLCYSQHTPFGIIDRGCFNVNRNLTTYVCSCNLCNYVSISEMPYIFPTIQDWADNVIELSRMKQLRKSVFKDMSCLSCEVNVTTKTADLLDSANCLEGNIGTLPIQECETNEICGVKAIRGDGYVWRGCVSAPLYNYWWTMCDTDLCNYDSIVSIYDLI